uniref:Uncharacterized protein n=1 Tax=Tanacetum cinerariifolium TaxID=118510 RepID=A0A699K1H5_TANCI|nr:hypothetical protein [Tanacetum cinerariifolium]
MNMYPTRKNNNMGYPENSYYGLPESTYSFNYPFHTSASKVLGPGTVSQRLKATVSACESQGLSNTNDITNEESIDAGDNGTLEGFSNNNNIKSGASSGGSGAVRGNGKSKGISSSCESGAVRGNFHSKGMSSYVGSGGILCY